MISPITTFQEIQDIQSSQEKKSRWILFKHSDTCPVSFQAVEVVNQIMQDYPDLPVLMLEVKSQRELSDEIETFFETRHESPQLLLFKGAILKDVKNHFAITNKGIEHLLGGGYAKKSL